MSPSPEEWLALYREAPSQWAMLVGAEIRHLRANADKGAAATLGKLENHEARLIRLETKLAAYAAGAGATTGGLIQLIIHFSG